jgi:la-related protein 1
MDSDGYVRLSFLMGFARVQLHTKDINVLRDACLQSHEIMLTVGVDDYYVRKQDGWENWVLREEGRDESARRNQSDWHIDPRQRRVHGSAITPPGEMSPSAEPFFPGAPIVGSMYFPQTMSAYGYIAPPSVFSPTVPEFSPSSNQEIITNMAVHSHATDECPDAEIDTLIVVVKRSTTGETPSPEAAPTRNISNGGSDLAGITVRLQESKLTNGGSHDERTNGTDSPTNQRSHKLQSDIGWFNSPRTGYNLEDSSMTHRSYTEVRSQAAKQRESFGPTKNNNDLITLYSFWSHFLVKRFNVSMYREFQSYALQDADKSIRTGVEEIFKLYERSLKGRSTIGLDIIRDFVELVRAEARHGEAFGVAKLKSILANPSLRDEYKSAIESLVDGDLRNVMENGVGKKNDRSPAAEPYIAVSWTIFACDSLFY